MATLREILAFCIGLATCGLGFFVAERFYLRARRKRKLIRRDANRIALDGRARISQIDRPFVLVAGDSTVSLLMLAPLSDLQVVNVAFPGFTSGAFADAIEAVMAGKRPLVTALSIGANDALQRDLGGDADRIGFRENLERIGRIVAGSELTLLLSLPRIAPSSQAYAPRRAAMDLFNEEARSFALRRNWIFFDCATALSGATLTPAQDSIDGLHLSPGAASILAATLRQTILDLLEARKSSRAAE